MHFAISITAIASVFFVQGEASLLDELLHSGTIFENVPMDVPQISVLSELTIATEVLRNITIVSQAYEKYKAEYGKMSTYSVNSVGLSVFQAKLIDILEHNTFFRAGLSSYEMGVNQFTDMTFEEFSGKYLGYVPEWGNVSDSASQPPAPSSVSIMAIPGDIDWRRLGHVTPVKNQGSCGSCVAFAATACLESSHSIYHNKQHLDLSEQELVDCSRGNGNNGCSGLTFVPTFNYLKDKGLGLEGGYPYEQRDGSCRSAGKPRGARVRGWWSVQPARDENKLKETVAQYGPTAVAIHVNNAFLSYRSGIFEAPCSGGRNHAGLVVGYNGENGRDFWIFKNSWGPGWGEQGYIRMRRHFGNICDIAGDAVFVNA